MRLVKKVVFTLLIVVLLFSGCSSSDFSDGYESGYNAGFEDAEYEFSETAKDVLYEYAYTIIEDFAVEVEDEFYYNVVRKTAKEFDLHPEEAIVILNDFKEGKHVTAEELYLAIDVVTYFYYECYDFIYGIEDIDFDVDLD